MKKYLYILLSCVVLVLGVMVTCLVKDKLIENKIKNEDSAQKAYLMAYNLGNQTSSVFKTKSDRKAFVKGFWQGVKGQKPILDQEEISNLQKKERQKNGQKSLSEGQAFLEKNSQRPGVKSTASGLQYKILKEGRGQSPRATDTVEVHYRGTLINGREFDSSYKRNQSISFPLNQVIQGWTEGLQLMKEGAKYDFYIPSQLAYGAGGAPNIPPHSVLIFEVELIKVK